MSEDSMTAAHQRWEARLAAWESRPDELHLTYTIVRCFHTYHPAHTYYLKPEEYTEHFMAITRSMWANGYTILVQPAD